MFDVFPAEQEAEVAVCGDSVHDKLSVATRKVTEPVGVPLKSEETSAVREVTEIADGARDTASVPDAN